MPSYYARVFITFKPEVLDPQGQAVRQALQSHGYTGLEEVRVGKYIELWLQAASEEAARRQVEGMCGRLLANPVMENYRAEVALASAPDTGGLA